MSKLSASVDVYNSVTGLPKNASSALNRVGQVTQVPGNADTKPENIFPSDSAGEGGKYSTTANELCFFIAYTTPNPEYYAILYVNARKVAGSDTAKLYTLKVSCKRLPP